MATITDLGVTAVSATQYINSIRDEWRGIFGDQMVFDDDTPQGQITSLLGLMAYSMDQQIVDTARSLDITQAQGQQIDDLVNILGVYRKAPSKSFTDATLYGISGTTVPAGSVATLLTGEAFSLRESVLIASNGAVNGEFDAVEDGAIAVPADSLVNISTTINGWESVNNPNAGSTGQGEETDPQLTRRYFQELYLNSTSLMTSILAGVYDLEDVQHASSLENDGDAPIWETGAEGVGLQVPAHGFVVAALGGARADIAEAIRERKSIGSNSMQMIACTFTGTADVTIPSGSEVTDGTNIYQLSGDVVLNAGNSLTANGYVFCTTDASVDIAIGEINAPVTVITNWDGVTNLYAEKFECVIVPVYNVAGDTLIQSIPINFVRIEPLPNIIYLRVIPNSSFPVDGHSQIRNNLVAYYDGSNNFTDLFELDGIQVSEDVYESRLYTPVNMVRGHSIESLEVAVKLYEDWDSTVSYADQAFVTGSNGSWYQSTIDSNLGNDPILGGSEWTTGVRYVGSDILKVLISEYATIASEDIYIES